MSDKHKKLIDDPKEEIIQFSDDISESEISPNFIIRENHIQILEKKPCCIIL